MAKIANKLSLFTNSLLTRSWRNVNIILTLCKNTPKSTKSAARRFNKWWRLKMRVFEHRRWSALGMCSIHLPPLAVSITLLVLNFCSIYYEDIGISNQDLRLNALQFAAKLHEVLIATSLSTVVVNYIQYELSCGKGLSLGAVLAGFQIANLNSLWSPGFWSRCHGKGLRTRRIRFITLVVFLVVLVAVSGPSSAILMLPSIAWWETKYKMEKWYLPNSITDGGDLEPHFLFSANESILWPTHVTLDRFPLPAVCNSNAATVIPQECPSAGLRLLLPRGKEASMTEANFTMPIIIQDEVVYNSFLESSSLEVLAPSCSDEPFCQTSQSVATSVSTPTIKMLGTAAMASGLQRLSGIKYKISQSNWTQLLGPQSFSLCSRQPIKMTNGSYHNLTGADLRFPLMDGNWTFAQNGDAASLSQLSDNPSTLAGIWIQLPYKVGDMPSIGAAFIGRNTEATSLHESLDELEDNISATRDVIVTCSVYVGWKEMGTYITTEGAMDLNVHTSFNDDPWNGNPIIGDNALGKKIEIDANWAGLALPMNSTVVQLAISTRKSHSHGRWRESLAISLSLLTTDAIAGLNTDLNLIVAFDGMNDIAHAGQEVGWELDVTMMNMNDVKSSTVTPVEIQVVQYGYSYSMKGLTRQLAVAILLMHIYIVLVHTVLVVGYGWSSANLRSLCDIVIVAINSSPNNTLQDESAEVLNSKRYKTTVKFENSLIQLWNLF